MGAEPLSERERALVGVSVALASRDTARVRMALETALRAAPPAEVEEVILQSYLFLGYPTALEGFGLWRELTGRHPEPRIEDAGTFRRRGEALGRSIYGGAWERLRANVRALHPDLERWMVEEGYGRVLGRDGLDPVARELCVAALLAVLDVPKQLHAHARGALRVGASPAQVEEALEMAAGAATPSAAASARETWRAVHERFVRRP